MKHFLIVLTLLLLGQGVVWASECPPGSTLQLVGQYRGQGATNASTEQISTAGAQVRMVIVAADADGATAATLYDVDGNGDSNDNTGVTGFVDGNVRLEPGAPTSDGKVYVFDPPVSFTDGIAVHDDGNLSGIGVYSCR